MGTSGECINRRKKRGTEPSTEHKENIRLLYEIHCYLQLLISEEPATAV